MLPALTQQTKRSLTQAGINTGAFFSVLAAGAGYLALLPWALGLTGLAVVGFGVSLFGVLAPQDYKRFKRLAVRDASSDDLDRFHARLAEFTPALVPLAERHNISRKNPACFRVIEDIRDADWRRSIEIFALYPLNQATVDAVLRGDLRGSDLRAQHIVKSFRVASGLYVSFAEGSSFTTRGLIIHEIGRAIAQIALRPLPVVTIPTTKEALTLVTNKGFLGLDGLPPRLGEVCALRLQHRDRIT